MKVNNTLLRKIPIHFIIGPGRSGSTLLMMLLNNSNKVIASPEIKHILYLKKSHKLKNGKANQKIIEKYLKEIAQGISNPLNKINLDQVLRDLNTFHYKHYNELSKKIHLSLHEKEEQEVDVIFDKNNLHTFYIRELIELFPEAKFCVCIRDYRGFVVSNLKSQHSFKEKKSMLFFAHAWRRYMIELKKRIGNYRDRFLILKYEDFVQNPKNELIRLSNFFNLEFDENCFHYRDKIKSTIEDYKSKDNIDPRILKKIEDLAKPINKDSVNKWEQELNHNELKKIESICGEIGEYFDYKKIHKVSLFNYLLINTFTLPTRFRINLFFSIKSIRLHHYLHVVKRSSHNRKNKYNL